MTQQTLEIRTEGERALVIQRSFAAPRQLVWDAHTKPELVRQWLLGPEGWTMDVCEIDLRPGGAFRYEWHNTSGETMGMGGTFVEVDAPARMVHKELFDDDWTGGETEVTTVLEESGGVTTLTLTVLYASAEAREGATASGMTEGMAVGYDRLAALVEGA